MKLIITTVLVLVFTISNIEGQELKEYSDLIKIDEEYETIKPNIDEMSGLDLSHFWKDNKSERRLGYIGSNYRKLDLKFLSIIKNTSKPKEYFVYGKSRVSQNICEFQGTIKITDSQYIKYLEAPDGNSGVLAGQYEFYENPNNEHAGIFKGRFVTYWYKDEKGNIKYNDLWDVSAMYNNNQFAGTWSEYGKSKTLSANWGDSRIPNSEGFDIGTSEFCPAQKYVEYGWLVFMIANGASPDRMNIEEARKALNEEWWK